MTTKEKINKDYMQAMKDKNVIKKNLLGVIKGEIQNEELRTGKEADVNSILKKMEKSLKTNNTEESQKELEILQEYLPQMMDEITIRAVIHNYYSEHNLRTMGDMMKKFNEENKGRADNNLVVKIIKETL